MIAEAYDYLNQGGNLTIVIQKKQKALRQLRLRWRMCLANAEVVKKDKGYYILKK